MTEVVKEREDNTNFIGWVTTAEAADILGVSQRYVRQLIAERRLEATKVAPRLWMIKLASLEQFASQR